MLRKSCQFCIIIIIIAVVVVVYYCYYCCCFLFVAAALCQKLFCTCDEFAYDNFRKFLKLHTLHNKTLFLDVLFSIFVCSGLKCCPTVLDIPGIRALSRNFRNSSLYNATCRKSPSARCVSVVSRVHVYNISKKPITSLKQILRYSATFLF